LSFSDLDVGGTHTASVAAQAGNLGTLVASVSKDTTGTGTGGVISWNYQVDEAQVRALSATTKDTFTLTLTDDQGCTATTAIVVNDLPHDFSVVTASDGSTSTSTSTSSCPTLVVITSPSDLTVTAGQTALFSAAASGTPAPSVQWQVSTDGGATFNNVPGETSTTLTFTASLSQNGNLYRAVFTNLSGTATSRAATLTVISPATTTALVSSQNPSVFGQAVTFSVTVSSPAGTPTGTVTFLDGATSIGTGTLDSSARAALSISSLAVGPHSITAVYSGDGNFSGSTSATLSSTVNPAPLTVKANSGSRQYGQADPALNNVTYSGFVNGDTFAVLSGTLTCTSSDAPSSPVGTYAINCSGLSSPNYLITYVPGTLTITPAPLTIEANNAARPYGANNPAFSGTITGLLNADPISATYAANSALPASPVGTYPVVPTAIGPANVLVNYTISLLNGTLTIGPEPTSLTVSFAPTSIIVGQTSTATITLTAPDMVILIDPSVLAPFTLTSPVVSDTLSNNGVCTPVPSATPGVASCTINVTSVEPNGRTLNSSFPGTGDLGASTGAADLLVTTALGSQTSCINSDFRKVPVPGGSYLWFNSIFRVRDVAKQKVNISFVQSKVQFQYKDASGNLVTVNQAMPDAKIVIDPSATTASTTFDAVNNLWLTTIPWDLDDNSFLTGTPWLVPAGGIPADIEPVAWCGTFASDVAGVDIGWRWAAAAYSSFSSDNTVLGVKPMNTDNDNPPRNHDRAGTPENFKQFVIPGARGKGGKNYTGTYSRSIMIE
jgi:VCBS repeat-containing protein